MQIDPIFKPKQNKNPAIFDIEICGAACQLLYIENCFITENSIGWKHGNASARISYIKDGYYRITIAIISGPTSDVAITADLIDAVKPKLLAAMYDKKFEPLTVVR